MAIIDTLKKTSIIQQNVQKIPTSFLSLREEQKRNEFLMGGQKVFGCPLIKFMRVVFAAGIKKNYMVATLVMTIVGN